MNDGNQRRIKEYIYIGQKEAYSVDGRFEKYDKKGNKCKRAKGEARFEL